MAGFRHLGDEPIADLARIKVVRSTFEAPDGSQFTRDVVRNQQVVAMVPSRDAVIVRLGGTFHSGQFDSCALVAQVLATWPH